MIGRSVRTRAQLSIRAADCFPTVVDDLPGAQDNLMYFRIRLPHERQARECGNAMSYEAIVSGGLWRHCSLLS
jgi:hypothetical protein